MTKLSASAIAGYAKAAGFPATEIPTAVAVALAESGGETTAVSPVNSNGTRDYGLWQINSVHAPLGDWANPTHNAQLAFQIWSARKSWTPWSTYTNGRYLTHLDTNVKPGDAPDMPGTAATGGSGADKGVASFTELMSTPGTWWRVGFTIGGSVMLIIGFRAMIGRAGIKIPKLPGAHT